MGGALKGSTRLTGRRLKEHGAAPPAGGAAPLSLVGLPYADFEIIIFRTTLPVVICMSSPPFVYSRVAVQWSRTTRLVAEVSPSPEIPA